MPFQTTTSVAFNDNGIASYAPTQGGVYGLFRHGQWLYVSQSVDIQDSLRAHLRAPTNPCLANDTPTHFVYELVPEGEQARLQREEALIAELGPKCNT